MKLYQVTDTDASTGYFTKRGDAERFFDACVADVEYPTGVEEVTLAEVHVSINSETVLRLLNGEGRYTEKETILKQWRAE